MVEIVFQETRLERPEQPDDVNHDMKSDRTELVA